MRSKWQLGIAFAVLVILVGLIAFVKSHRNQRTDQAKPTPNIPSLAQTQEAAPSLPKAPVGEAKTTRQMSDDEPAQSASEDLQKAQAILERHIENFKDINSLSFHDQQSLTWLNGFRGIISTIVSTRKGDNFSYDVEITRDPSCVKTKGVRAGEKFNKVMTSSSVESDGKPGQDAGWLSHDLSMYLDGELYFKKDIALKSTSSVQDGIKMVSDIPGMEDILRSPAVQNSEYSVLIETKQGSEGVRTMWFNRTTGMMEFITCRKPNTKAGENPYESALFVEYGSCDGILYPKRSICYDWDFAARKERTISKLVINGQPVSE